MSTCADHTYGPEGYVERAEWGERMVETHVQSACDECHLYLIWTPKDGPCASYTARSWSPTAEAPEDDRCVNCGQSEGLHSGSRDTRPEETP